MAPIGAASTPPVIEAFLASQPERCEESPQSLVFVQAEPSESLWCNQKEFAINWEDPIEFMERISAPDFDPRAADVKSGHTPLMMAARHGHIDCVKALLPHSDPNAQQQWGVESDYYFADRTAIHLAVERGHSEIVRLLAPVSDLSLSGSCDYQYGWATPLELAVLKGNHELVKFLAPLSPPAEGQFDQCNPMSLAVELKDAESIRILLPFGDARRVVGNGFTPLMSAAYDGFVEGVRLLLPVSDVKAKNSRSQSALHLAAYYGDYLGAGVFGPCADLLAPHADRAEVDEIFAEVGAKRMPQWAARLEREALANAIAESPPAIAIADMSASTAPVCNAASVSRNGPKRI